MSPDWVILGLGLGLGIERIDSLSAGNWHRLFVITVAEGGSTGHEGSAEQRTGGRSVEQSQRQVLHGEMQEVKGKEITGIMRLSGPCWQFRATVGNYELIGPKAIPLRKVGLGATLLVRLRPDVETDCNVGTVAEVLEVLALAPPLIPNRTLDETYRSEQTRDPEVLEPGASPGEGPEAPGDPGDPRDTLSPDERMEPDPLIKEPAGSKRPAGSEGKRKNRRSFL